MSIKRNQPFESHTFLRESWYLIRMSEIRWSEKEESDVQHMNKAKAMQILAIRLQNRQNSMYNDEIDSERRSYPK